MSLLKDLKADVQKIFRDQWTSRDGQKVPDSEELKLGNDAVKLDATVLYADLSRSTDLVDRYDAVFAAEIYKAYLGCTAKIIGSNGGTITAYDGDRIMAVYIGEHKNTHAARTALQINYAIREIVNPALKIQYGGSAYEVKQAVGIDTSKLFVARTGIRGSNDLVWVGKAANYAAKLSEAKSESSSWITDEVYQRLEKSVKFAEGKPMWEAKMISPLGPGRVYCSNWWWTL